MGGTVQLLHFFLVPETRSTILLDREAKKRRKHGESNIYGPNELKTFKDRFSMKEIGKIWWRPWLMFFTEPIVLCLSLLSGFADMLVFIFLEAFTPVFEQWDFKTWQIGLCFLSYVSWLPIEVFANLKQFHHRIHHLLLDLSPSHLASQ